jgi:hypothetical protein
MVISVSNHLNGESASTLLQVELAAPDLVIDGGRSPRTSRLGGERIDLNKL